MPPVPTFSEYIPSWQRASAAPPSAATQPPNELSTASPAYIPHFSATRTSSNFHHVTAPPPSAAVPFKPYSFGASGSRPGFSVPPPSSSGGAPLQGVPSGSGVFRSGPLSKANSALNTPHFRTNPERSPIGGVPTRIMTPAMAATKSMNPFACEYAPLPSSTAAAPQAPPAAATRERSMREMLGAAAFVPRRTLHRVILDRPPLLPESTAGKSGANVAGTPLGEGEEIDLGVMAGKFRDMWKVHYLPRGDSWVSKSQADIFDPVVVASIEDIPTFWRVFNHLPTPQSKKTGAYYVFRDDIPPKWEDEANQGGGMLRVTVSEALVDEAWELLLLRAVGCSWVTPDGRQLVNGVVAKMRGGGQYALELWVKRETQEIQREMEELWTSELGGVFAMQYICFSEASAAGKSHQKPNKPSKSAGKVSHKDAVTGPMVVVAAPKSGYSNNHYKKGMNSFAR